MQIGRTSTEEVQPSRMPLEWSIKRMGIFFEASVSESLFQNVFKITLEWYVHKLSEIQM